MPGRVGEVLYYFFMNPSLGFLMVDGAYSLGAFTRTQLAGLVRIMRWGGVEC